MDFHMMKRKKLQKLCKKHQLPANLTNSDMLHNLSSLLKIEEKGELMKQPRPCLKNCSSENAVKKKQKKVRFSPQNEVFQLGDKKIQLYQLPRVKSKDQMVLISTKASSYK